jgi:hypothetical protein
VFAVVLKASQGEAIRQLLRDKDLPTIGRSLYRISTYVFGTRVCKTRCSNPTASSLKSLPPAPSTSMQIDKIDRIAETTSPKHRH